MQYIYRLILIEDDAAFAGSLHQALNKQHLYSLPIEIRTFTYAEFNNQLRPTRNSSREILIFGGREELGFAPDAALLKQYLAKQDRSHFFVLTTVEDGKNVLDLWQPGVSGIIERAPKAQAWLTAAVQRIQLRQQVRGASRSYPSAQTKKGFLSQLRAALFGFFA